jgi:beta-glucanase (GH16 family)
MSFLKSSANANSPNTRDTIQPGIKPTVTLPDGYSLVWRDEFDSTALNPKKWYIETGPRRNGYNTKEAVTFSDSKLRIHTYTNDTGGHCTGFITTQGGRYSVKYGFIEARMNFHSAPGNHGAFWLQSPTLGKLIGDTRTAGTEIDITEHRLQDNSGKMIDRTSNSALHWDGYGADHKQRTHTGQSPTSLNDSWHTYAVLWTPDQYIFYIDGKEHWRTDTALSAAPEYLLLTCEISDMLWSGKPPAEGYGPFNTSPYGMEVDWVRVWQKK